MSASWSIARPNAQGAAAVERLRARKRRPTKPFAIYHEHPDLAEVLQTEFTAITVGFVEHGQIHQYLAPQPPPACGGHRIARGECIQFHARGGACEVRPA